MQCNKALDEKDVNMPTADEYPERRSGKYIPTLNRLLTNGFHLILQNSLKDVETRG
jgi:hypothetical protein